MQGQHWDCINTNSWRRRRKLESSISSKLQGLSQNLKVWLSFCYRSFHCLTHSWFWANGNDSTEGGNAYFTCTAWKLIFIVEYINHSASSHVKGSFFSSECNNNLALPLWKHGYMSNYSRGFLELFRDDINGFLRPKQKSSSVNLLPKGAVHLHTLNVHNMPDTMLVNKTIK